MYLEWRCLNISALDGAFCAPDRSVRSVSHGHTMTDVLQILSTPFWFCPVIISHEGHDEKIHNIELEITKFIMEEWKKWESRIFFIDGNQHRARFRGWTRKVSRSWQWLIWSWMSWERRRSRNLWAKILKDFSYWGKIRVCGYERRARTDWLCYGSACSSVRDVIFEHYQTEKLEALF